jgi:hypothetical protein
VDKIKKFAKKDYSTKLSPEGRKNVMNNLNKLKVAIETTIRTMIVNKKWDNLYKGKSKMKDK